MSAPSPLHQSVGHRRRDLVVVIAFLVLLAAPAIAYGFGVRPENRENRPLATLPPLTTDVLIDAKTFAAIDRFVADRFPFRNFAVTVDAAGRYLLGTSANPEVAIGDDGWLFSRDSLQASCTVNYQELATALDAVADRFGDEGIGFRLVIVPDKRSVYRDVAPSEFEPCTDDQRERLQAALSSRRDVATDLWRVLADARDTERDRLYWAVDTHWTPIGAVAGLRALIRDMAPHVWDEDAVVREGHAERVGDLSNLMGMPIEEPAAVVRIINGNEVTRTTVPTPMVETPGRGLERFDVTGDAPVISGTTLIIHDSAFGTHPGLVAPWFRTSVWLHVNELIEHPDIVGALPPFDQVIFERVERFAYSRRLEEIVAPLLRLVTSDGDDLAEDGAP